jgi:hypothetical protein
MDLGFPATLEQIRQDLKAIVPIVETLTGLKSRWNGNVEFVSDAIFKGLKPYACDILIGDTFLDPDERWTTLIHELLHSVSAGYNRFDFEANVGWEEGVVENLQRILRAEILSELELVVAEDLLRQLDEQHPFNRYIMPLERARDVFGDDEREFHLDLLRTPIKNRYGALMMRANAMPVTKRGDAIRVLSTVQGALGQGRTPR